MSVVVRMTSSAAEAHFAARPGKIGAHEVTSHVLDLVQMSDIDIETRVAIGVASDDLARGEHDTHSIRAVAGAYNRLAGH